MPPTSIYPHPMLRAATRSRGHRTDVVLLLCAICLLVGALIAWVALAYLVSHGTDPFSNSDAAETEHALPLPTPLPAAEGSLI